jgi:uncharacterized protein YjbJ (UPF0337 family)
MNWQKVKTNWSTVKDEIHTKWGKLTDSDLKAIDGRRDELVKRLQQRYAMDQEKAEKEAEDFVQKLN